jgi:hypothetical protein
MDKHSNLFELSVSDEEKLPPVIYVTQLFFLYHLVNKLHCWYLTNINILG